MRMTRSYAVLKILFDIKDKGSFTEKDVVQSLSISRSTFFRALIEFRCYLTEHRPWEELVFDQENQAYRLKRIII